MAEAFFNAYCHPECARAISAGTAPADEIDPNVLVAMREIQFDLASQRPKRLTADLVQEVQSVITMGCGDDPAVHGVRREEWPIDDPHGASLDDVRRIRDDLKRRVWKLVVREGWVRLQPRALMTRSRLGKP